jgi:hypothetical protein
MYSLKTSWEYILLSTFEQKTAFSAIFRAKSVGIGLFWRRFRTFWTAWKAYLTSLPPPTTNPRPGSPPANRQRTKQFLSRPCGLFLSEGAELPTMAAARLGDSPSPIGPMRSHI